MIIREPSFARPQAVSQTTTTTVKRDPSVVVGVAPGAPPVASVGGGSALIRWGIPLAIVGVGVFLYLRRRKK